MEGEMSTEEWMNVISQVQRFSLVTFTGGEPFVRKDFMDILTYASSKARTHFISNTTMLPEERAEAVANLAPKRIGGLGFNFAGTSIEGPRERHDEIRKLRGAFDRSMNGIRLLRQIRQRMGKKCPMIHVTTVLQQDNIDVLHYLPKIMKEAGVDVINFVTESRALDLPNIGEVDPQVYKTEDLRYPRIDKQQLADGLSKSVAEAKKHGIELRLPRMPKEDLLEYYGEGRLDLSKFECRNAWNTLFVDRRGDAYPCCARKVGNVHEGSLKDIWNGLIMRDFRQTCQKTLFAACPGCCFLEHKSSRDLEKTVPAATNSRA
jgi:radical SAM protein with 4Fe4S-binding SPASM domain